MLTLVLGCPTAPGGVDNLHALCISASVVTLAQAARTSADLLLQGPLSIFASTLVQTSLVLIG